MRWQMSCHLDYEVQPEDPRSDRELRQRYRPFERFGVARMVSPSFVCHTVGVGLYAISGRMIVKPQRVHRLTLSSTLKLDILAHQLRDFGEHPRSGEGA